MTVIFEYTRLFATYSHMFHEFVSVQDQDVSHNYNIFVYIRLTFGSGLSIFRSFLENFCKCCSRHVSVLFSFVFLWYPSLVKPRRGHSTPSPCFWSVFLKYPGSSGAFQSCFGRDVMRSWSCFSEHVLIEMYLDKAIYFIV